MSAVYSLYRAVQEAKVKVKEAFLLENKFHFAKEIIYQAGAFLREHLYDDLDVSQKTSATDLVTRWTKVQDDLVAKF